MTRGLHGPVGARMSSTRYDRWLETLHFERPAERIVFDDSRDVIRGGAQRERRRLISVRIRWAASLLTAGEKDVNIPRRLLALRGRNVYPRNDRPSVLALTCRPTTQRIE